MTAGLLVPSDSPLGSAGPSALPSSAGGSAGIGAGSFFAASHQHPEQGGLDMPHDAAHMLTEPSGIGGQVRSAPECHASSRGNVMSHALDIQDDHLLLLADLRSIFFRASMRISS